MNKKLTSDKPCVECGEPFGTNRRKCTPCDRHYMANWRRSKGIKTRQEWKESIRSANHCPDCKTEKPLTEFYRAKTRTSGYQNICKQCASERNKQYRKNRTPEQIEKQRKQSNKSSRKQNRKKTNSIKRMAHTYVRLAIMTGQLSKQPCEKCGAENAIAHHDNYTDPINVRWLCQSHHRQYHAKDVNGFQPFNGICDEGEFDVFANGQIHERCHYADFHMVSPDGELFGPNQCRTRPSDGDYEHKTKYSERLSSWC